MATIMSLTVTLRMENGELRAGLELRAVTKQDGRDLAELIDTANQRGLYDKETKTLGFNGLGGYDLYWSGLGVEDRKEFAKIPRGSWGKGAWRVLFMSDPRPYVAQPVPQSDLIKICICRDGFSCRTCRLQKRVETAESKLRDAKSQVAGYIEGMVELVRGYKKYQKLYGDVQIRDTEDDDSGEDGGEGDDVEEDGEDQGEEEREESQSEEPTALEHALNRAATAELENAPLLVEIARLKRENKDLRNEARNQRNQSSSSITQVTSSMRANPSARGASDGSQSDTDHPQHGRGGKTRPGGAAKSGVEPVGRIGETTGGRTKGKSGYARTTKGSKTVKKRQRDTYDEVEDEDEDEDEEPPFKRHQSAALASGRAVEGQKGGRKIGAITCGPQKLAKKKHQESSDDSDDESFNPGHQGRRSGFPHNADYTSLGPKANQTIAKTGRRTNNSQAGFLDAFGFSSLTSSSRDTLGVFGSGSATKNSMSGFMDDEEDASTSDFPKATFSSAATPATSLTTSATANPTQAAAAISNTLTTATPVNPTQTAAASRKPKPWSDAELQALIALVRAHQNPPVGLNGNKPEVLHDVRLFELMSRQLRAQGVDRGAGACKNEWNRRGRQLSGIDNRIIANPGQMATSLQ